MAAEKKVFAGPRVRRLRRERGLTQARMATDLGISASYLNLIERNQRPMSAQILLKLAEVYDIELRSLGGDDEARAMTGLREVFADPLFRDSGLTAQDIQEVAAASPTSAEAIATLYRAYQQAVVNTSLLAERLAAICSMVGRRSRHLWKRCATLSIAATIIFRSLMKRRRSFIAARSLARTSLMCLCATTYARRMA